MNDRALERSGFITDVVARIEEARSMGIPVIMVTRNDDDGIERFFQAHPEAREMFDETISCPSGGKSVPIKAYLETNAIPAEAAAFVDDTQGELDEVRESIPGIRTYEPMESRVIRFEKQTACIRQRMMTLFGENGASSTRYALAA